MKTSLKAKKNKKARTEVQFVRVFSFYVDITITGEKAEPYFFKVTVATQAAFNQQTGMTVDLVKLNRVAGKVFKNQKTKCSELQEFFKLKYQTLKESLANYGIQLCSIQFDECRGLSVLVQNINLYTFRHDFATDDKGTLYFVSSQFDQKNQLSQIKIKNLKLNIEEQIIF